MLEVTEVAHEIFATSLNHKNVELRAMTSRSVNLENIKPTKAMRKV